MTKLLVSEHPLIVLPSLAKAIGLNEAIVLQQIHYWLDPTLNKNYKEGAFWVYNTYQEWVAQFPFWSKDTVKRTIQSLEKQEILIAKNLNKDRFDKTKWYTINYQQLAKIESKISDNNHLFEGCKLHPSKEGNLHPSKEGTLHPSIYKETETTTETSNSLSQKTSKGKNIEKKYLPEGEEREMLNIWSELVEEEKIVKQITQTRKAKLNKYFKRYFQKDLEQWKKFCGDIKSSKFLMGNVTNFKASLDWVLKEENLIKILEGDYGINRTQLVKEESNVEHLDQKVKVEGECSKSTLIREGLISQLGKDIYNSWFKRVTIEVSGRIVSFKVPTKFIYSYIYDNYYEILQKLVKIKHGEGAEIKLFHETLLD